MRRIVATLVIGMLATLLLASTSISTISSAFAQSRLGQIARDGLTNRYEPAPSEIAVELRLDM